MNKLIWLSDLVKTNFVQFQQSEVALCYGTFNVVHPGHLRYFETARSYATKLHVAIEGDCLSDLAQTEIHFPAKDRALTLLQIERVDRVIVLDKGTLRDLVKGAPPKTLVLGKEFEREPETRAFAAIQDMQTRGGEVVFEAGDVNYSSLALFHRHQADIEGNRLNQFREILDKHQIDLSSVARIAGNKRPNLLVIGDSIVDEYVACDAIGMSAEAPVVVVRERETRNFVGGASIVASHLAALGANCHYLSVAGEDAAASWLRKALQDNRISADVYSDALRPTTVKIRYMVENQKLFRVSRLKESAISRTLEQDIIARLEDLVPDVDGVVISDFVYGLVTDAVLDAVTQLARKHKKPLFGDVQSSRQIGNILKFQKFDLLCPTEREARISLSNQDDGLEWVANSIIEQTATRYLLLTMGGDGFIAYGPTTLKDERVRQHFPALVANPVDVAGAGDALLSTMVFFLTAGVEFIAASALSNCAAALAVRSMGNNPISSKALSDFCREWGL